MYVINENQNLFVFFKGRKTLHDADSQMKRSQSVSQQIGNSSPPSGGRGPMYSHPYTPLSPPVPPPNPRASPKIPSNGSNSRYAGSYETLLYYF